MKPSPDSCLHPRLFIAKGGFDALKKKVEGDATLCRIFECLKRKAEQFCKLPSNTRIVEGRRLLGVSRSCLERILALALVGRVADEERYVRRAAEEMLAVAAFTDWNPSHFLDTAEMTFALATGYDWLYDQLSEQERETIATAIREKGLLPSLEGEQSKTSWITGTNNWNQVCHAGMTAGALALAEHDPKLAERILQRAVENVPRVNVAYAPDGAYAEGTMYWDYGTSFQVALIDMLQTALGQEYGLAGGKGFLESARYICQMTSPDGGKFFNYADNHETRGFKYLLLWFAGRLGLPALAAMELRRLDAALSNYESRGHDDHYRLLALTLTWPETASQEGAVGNTSDLGLTRSWLGQGIVPVAIHRTAWDDPRAVCVGIKGGSPAAPHGHMDGGSFVLDVDGVRWASDLGMQEYHSLEKLGVQLWDGRQNGDRWTVFRLGIQGHGVLSFNGAPQLVSGHAPVVRHAGDDAAEIRHTVFDLSSLYADHATRVWRGAGLRRDGRVVLQDEWMAGTLAVDVRWQMLTFAQITVDEQGGRFLLSQGDRRLELRVEVPDGGKVQLSVEDWSAPVHSYDVPNPGLSLLVLALHTEPGDMGAVRLTASLPAAAGETLPAWQAMADWSRAG